MSYELHVLVRSVSHHAQRVKLEVLCSNAGWWTSTLREDHGNGDKADDVICTTHSPTERAVEGNSAYNRLCEFCLTCQESGFKVVRAKIERVILDTKLGHSPELLSDPSGPPSHQAQPVAP